MSAQEFFDKPFDKPNEARQTDENTGGLPPRPEVRGSFWSRCHDRWALVAFLTSFTVYLFLSIYCLYKVGTDYDNVTDIDVPGDWQASSSGTTSSSGEIDYGEAFTKETGYLFALASAVAVGLSFGLLFFVRYFPTVTIIMGPLISLLYMIGATVGCIYLKVWGEAAISAASAAFIVLCVFLFKSRYRLARDLLDTANMAAKAHWSVFWTVIIGTLVQGLSSLWNIATFISVFLVFEPWHQGCDDGDYCSAGMTWALLIFVIIEYMWISGVISSVTLTVMAGGPYAHWWYGTDLDTRSESIWALKRAAGTSLGSIAFGSLLVTAVEVLHFLVKLITGQYFGEEGKGICACCCGCLLRLMEYLLETFNKYVYIRIGVDRFEIDFKQGGKEIWRLVKKGKKVNRKGISALLSDNIVGKALHMTCMGNAVLCAGLTYLYMAVVDGSLKVDEWWNWLILLYSFILALNIGLTLTSALEAGVSTIFVCLDKDPDYLKQRNPRFYDDLCAHPSYYSIVMPEADQPLQPREKA
ncbi:hypothetical protein B9479_003088 [Cryptococcus floricola]|uniref:Protein PNS1 n=1 Tax=Cryptococcus floricola TaxID=2591691 RepID=A0A5D3B1W6_9TREE|nr:hypothetical protein B9479_003088 [Cryptococcus floricola]